jgi:hypothetical protein
MKQELENKLYQEFPAIFCEDESSRRSSLSTGFECGDGWYDLIREMAERIYKLIGDKPPPKIEQVKEKFGELRIYASGTNKRMKAWIDKACHKSQEICEVCGSKGEIDYDKRWLECRCPRHKKK